MIKAALIDMDGVLYDSMPFHAKAWHRMFTEQDINTDSDEFFLYEGMTGGATINLIFQRELGREATEKEKRELYHRKSELFKKFGKKKMIKGSFEFLALMREKGLTTVLVTGSGQGSLLDGLNEDFPGIFPVHRRVTAFDVTKGKPDPEPYLKGLEKAGVDKSEAIVVENAPLGVRAGKAAGCFTVAVMTGPVPREAFEKEGADIIFSDMHEFADWLEKNDKIQDKSSAFNKEICQKIEELNPDKVIVVTDGNIKKRVYPLFRNNSVISQSPEVVIEPGEENKDLKSVIKIWESLEEAGATRNSLLINIGGGMVTDIGGFAAATFKRGIRYINIPTSLLGAVDAATGGKTGFNFHNLKNEIGAFHKPEAVIISSLLFLSLPYEELLSGYGEILKTALITDTHLYDKVRDVKKVLNHLPSLESVVNRCVEIKEEIVTLDPREKGLRKVLNFGHTVGHAFESLILEKCKKEKSIPTPHGIAVAHGILVELLLSSLMLELDKAIVEAYAGLLTSVFPSLDITDKDFHTLIKIMYHDKKNHDSKSPNFTLLKEIGNPVIDCYPSKGQIERALTHYLSAIGT